MDNKQKPICETNSNGAKEWYLNGKCHREDGPAIEWAHGTKYWYLNGKRHRENGPAIEYADGTKGWYLNGEYCGNLKEPPRKYILALLKTWDKEKRKK